MRPSQPHSEEPVLPTLSVLVPTLNEAANVGACVESALALRPGWGEPVEVIVADGGSRDETVELASAAGAKVVVTPRGRGPQLRGAAAVAEGGVLLMLHADCRIDRAAGEQLRDALRDPQVAAGAFRQRIDAVGVGYRMLERANAARVRVLGLPYGDQAIFLRRDTLEAAGGVPDLPLMEDVALMQRVRRVAWPRLLPGPVQVSARRWRQGGVVRQTLRNWTLLAAFSIGVPAERVARHYRPHDG